MLKLGAYMNGYFARSDGFNNGVDRLQVFWLDGRGPNSTSTYLVGGKYVE